MQERNHQSAVRYGGEKWEEGEENGEAREIRHDAASLALRCSDGGGGEGGVATQRACGAAPAARGEARREVAGKRLGRVWWDELEHGARVGEGKGGGSVGELGGELRQLRRCEEGEV